MAVATTGIDENRLDDWRAYEGVRTRRVVAFCLDYVFVLLLSIPFAVIVFFLGIISLGLGFALYSILLPAVALLYVATTLGGQNQATTGMKAMGIKLERLDGRRVDPLFAILHSVLFWAANVLLTPLILLATFIFNRKRTLHDLLLGTVVTRRDF